MSATYYTLADLLKINDKGTVDAGLTDILNQAPFLAQLPFITASNGTVHKYVKETTAPSVGFRAINAGRDQSPSSDTAVTATLVVLDGSFHVDKALADAYRYGADGFISREGARALRQLFFVFEKQIFGGTVNGDAAGFSGFADVFTALANSKVINAAGTTATTGSSAYLIRATGDEKDVMGVVGQEGQIDLAESVVSTTLDGSGKSYPTYYTAMCGYAGVAVGGANSIARIANLTADSGKGLTDALIYDAMALFPAGSPPTHIAINRRSLAQLRKSRTATNATGAPAPIPTEVEGVKIVVTDAITSTEALLT